MISKKTKHFPAIKAHVGDCDVYVCILVLLGLPVSEDLLIHT